MHEEVSLMAESLMNVETTIVSEQLQADVLERIEGGKMELPLLPTVVWEVMELSAADDVDMRRLSDLIHRDQSLAGHVLRMANSPAYMARMPIVSLQQAVSRLGTKALGEIAFAVSLHSRVFDVPGYENDIRCLWEHAVGAAAYAKEIARLRRGNVEGAFLCALLHDIGKPVILQALVDVQKEMGVQIDPAVASAIMEAYHTHVGSLIATAWALPPHVAESIAYHHDYLVAPTCGEAVMVTRLADCLSYHLLAPDVFDEDSVRHHPVLADLNLYPDDVEALLAKRDVILRTIEGLS
jgi:putative nucleotidyltransferase with HDIG domain